MTIQRYHAYHSGDPHKVGLWADRDGVWVLYSDHVKAVEEARREYVMDLYESDDYMDGRKAERARIREAVKALPHHGGWKTPPVGRVDLVDKWAVLSIIEGEPGHGTTTD